jgi:hypothetical protein
MSGGSGRLGRLLVAVALSLSGAVVVPVVTAGPASASANEWIQLENVTDDTPWVLDVANWGTADRSSLHIWELRVTGDVSNQRWSPVVKSLSGTTYTLALVGNGSSKCLDKSMDQGNVNYAAVYIYTCRNTTNQFWRYNPNSSGFSDLRNVADPSRCLTAFGDYEGAWLDVEDCHGYVQQSWHIANF